MHIGIARSRIYSVCNRVQISMLTISIMQSVQLEAGYAMEFLENHRLVFLKHGDIYQQNAGYVLSLESKLFLMYTGLARNRIIIYNKVQNISYQIHVEGRYMYKSLGISTLTISNAYIYRYSQNRDVHWRFVVSDISECFLAFFHLSLGPSLQNIIQ